MNKSSQKNICKSCGAAWHNAFTCEDAFHQCLAWEFDEPQTRFEVHHLMVLCYHLQHPHLYSERGLIEARNLLGAFMDGESTEKVRSRRDLVDQANRDWKITANSESVGSYDSYIKWRMNIFDVLEKGPDLYNESVMQWAETTYESFYS